MISRCIQEYDTVQSVGNDLVADDVVVGRQVAVTKDVDADIVTRDRVAVGSTSSDRIGRRILEINPYWERILGRAMPGGLQSRQPWPEHVALNLVTRRVGTIDVDAGLRVAHNRIAGAGNSDLVAWNVVDPDPDHVRDEPPVVRHADEVADDDIVPGYRIAGEIWVVDHNTELIARDEIPSGGGASADSRAHHIGRRPHRT